MVSAPKASVTERRWIRWLPEAPTEDTSTLVLSAPTGHFVDVRIRRAETSRYALGSYGDSGRSHMSISTNDNHNHNNNNDDIDWAFAGRSHRWREDQSGGSGDAVVHGRWEHWVDSRTESGKIESVVDEGILTTLQDSQGSGSELELELERGEMVNPRTGVLQEYEELWADLPAEFVRPVAHPATKVACIVLTLGMDVDSVSASQGICIRIGQMSQGILRRGKEVRVSRQVAGAEEAQDLSLDAVQRLVHLSGFAVPVTLEAAMNPGNELAASNVGRELGGEHEQWKVEYAELVLI